MVFPCLERRFRSATPALHPLHISAQGTRWIKEERAAWRSSGDLNQGCILYVLIGHDADKESDHLLQCIAYDSDVHLASAALRTLGTTCRRMHVYVASSPYIPALRRGLELFPHQVAALRRSIATDPILGIVAPQTAFTCSRMWQDDGP